MSHNKPRRSVFLLAAELEAVAQEGNHNYFDHVFSDGTTIRVSYYSCLNIESACYLFDLDVEEYLNFYKKLYQPKDGWHIWWPRLVTGEFDYESRILALLLCAEMLRR